MATCRCTDAGTRKRFTINFGFENRRFDEMTITGALQMYYSGMSVRDISGMSVRDISGHYEMMGVKVNHSTIYRWVSDYSKMTAKYLNGIVPHVGNWFRADEVWVKINGKQDQRAGWKES